MKKSISQWSFPEGMELRRCFQVAKEAGFEGVEVAIGETGELTLESTPEDVERIVKVARELGIGISSLATGLFWTYSLTSNREEIRAKAKQVVLKMLEVASWLGVDTILVIPGAVNVPWEPQSEIISYEVAYQRSKEALKELAPAAESKKVYIGLENVWNKFLLSPLEFRNFLEEIGSDWVQAYFDVGNVVLTGYPEHWIRVLGKRIKRVHIKDFRAAVGNLNGFVDLLEGDVNWPAVVEALREIGYDGWVTAEMLPPYRFYSEQLIYTTSKSMDKILGR